MYFRLHSVNRVEGGRKGEQGTEIDMGKVRGREREAEGGLF